MKTENTDNSIPFRMINLLLGGHYTKEDIISNLKISETSFYKSLNKIRNAGFDLKSSNQIYHIRDYNTKLELTNRDKSLLAYMLALSFLLLPKEKTIIFKNFLRRLTFFSNKDDFNEILKKFNYLKLMFLSEQYNEKITTLKKCVLSNNTIKIILRSGKELYLKPKNISLNDEKIYLKYINSKLKSSKEQNLSIDRIAKIIINSTQEYMGQNDEVIYEIYGKLVKSYLLKDNERVVDSTKNSLVIASGTKNKEELYRRLLRYDTMCKVVSPKKAVIEFHDLINAAIENLNKGYPLNSDD